jgi:translocating chain-associated membrane protein 1
MNSMTRIGLALLLIDFVVNFIFHFSRILYFCGKSKVSKISFNIYNVVFVLTRIKVIVMAVFILWFGFEKNTVDTINWETGNFNTKSVRILSVGTVLTLQAWMLWNFILFQCKRIRENTKAPSVRTTPKRTPKKSKFFFFF